MLAVAFRVFLLIAAYSTASYPGHVKILNIHAGTFDVPDPGEPDLRTADGGTTLVVGGMNTISYNYVGGQPKNAERFNTSATNVLAGARWHEFDRIGSE